MVSHYTTRKKKPLGVLHVLLACLFVWRRKNRHGFCTYYMPMSRLSITPQYLERKNRHGFCTYYVPMSCLSITPQERMNRLRFCTNYVPMSYLSITPQRRKNRTFCVSITLQERMNRHGFCKYYVPMFCCDTTTVWPMLISDEPLLSGQPLLSGHLPFPRGWPLDRCSAEYLLLLWKTSNHHIFGFRTSTWFAFWSCLFIWKVFQHLRVKTILILVSHGSGT